MNQINYRKILLNKRKTIFCHLLFFKFHNLPRLKNFTPKFTTFIIIIFLRIDIYFIHINFHLFDFHFIRTHESQSWGNLIFYDWRHSRQGQKIEKKTNIQWYIKHVCWFLVKKMFFILAMRPKSAVKCHKGICQKSLFLHIM